MTDLNRLHALHAELLVAQQAESAAVEAFHAYLSGGRVEATHIEQLQAEMTKTHETTARVLRLWTDLAKARWPE